MDLQEALAEIEKLQKTLAQRGPRACVTGLVTDATDSRIALIKHKHRGKWELAGGKIGDEGHEGETWQDALLREMWEELGVKVTVASGPPIEVLNGPAVAGANYRSVVLVVRAVVEGDLTPGDDAVAARMFERSEIPWDDLSDLASKEIISLWANEEVLESVGPGYPVEQIRTHLGLGPDDEDVETISRVREMKRKSAVYDKLVTHHKETFSQLVAQMTADAVVLPSLGVDTPWPLADVLTKLIEATDLLLGRYDYDGLGWESINHARSAARGFVEQLRGAFAPKDGV